MSLTLQFERAFDSTAERFSTADGVNRSPLRQLGIYVERLEIEHPDKDWPYVRLAQSEEQLTDDDARQVYNYFHY